jgi:hypothetical protein
LWATGILRGLASRKVTALEHHDLEAAHDQLVPGTHAWDAAAEDDYASGMRFCDATMVFSPPTRDAIII